MAKSTIRVEFTNRMRKEHPTLTILFSLESLREGRALHDLESDVSATKPACRGPYPDPMLAQRSVPSAGACRRFVSAAALGVGSALLATGAAAVALHAVPSVQLMNRYTVMAAAFIPYGLPAFAGAVVIFATSPRRWVRPVTVAAVAGVVLQAWWARPYWPAQSPAPGSTTFAVLTMNLRCDSRGISDLAALTERVRPDVAVVQGLYAVKREALGDAWAGLLPYSSFHPMPHLPECGTFVFSRTPLRELSGTGEAQPVLEVDGPSRPIVLLPVDLPTPSKGVEPWFNAFTHLTEAVTAHPDRPFVVAGDFNAVREHEPLRRLLADTGLRDAAEVAGAGWTPTFPSNGWHPPLVGLDHVLVSEDVRSTSVATAPIAGQDHRALVAWLVPG